MTQNATAQANRTEINSMRPFFIIWSGQAISLLGSSLVQFALIWHLITTTGSATVLGVWRGFKNRMLTSILGLVLQSTSFLIVGFTPHSALLLLIIMMGFIGVANPLINSPFFAALQATVPNAIQGRVLTSISSGFQATMPIGLLIAGPLADRLGVQLIYILCGSVTLMNSIIFFHTSSALLRNTG